MEGGTLFARASQDVSVRRRRRRNGTFIVAQLVYPFPPKTAPRRLTQCERPDFFVVVFLFSCLQTNSIRKLLHPLNFRKAVVQIVKRRFEKKKMARSLLLLTWASRSHCGRFSWMAQARINEKLRYCVCGARHLFISF